MIDWTVRYLGSSSWAPEMVGVLLGAFMGALLGLGSQWWYDREQTRARRETLFRALRLQMGTITITPASSGSTGVELLADRRAHFVPAINHLLASNVLDAKRDADIILSISMLQSSLDAHNDALYHLKTVLITSSTNESVRDISVGALNQAHEDLRRNIDRVDYFLPPDTMRYSRPRPWPRNTVESA